MFATERLVTNGHQPQDQRLSFDRAILLPVQSGELVETVHQVHMLRAEHSLLNFNRSSQQGLGLKALVIFQIEVCKPAQHGYELRIIQSELLLHDVERSLV